ncbi:hypothetical protein RB195_015946 [Necator americanus]|uniref:Trypsin Inhibitor like cysteine rich domain protein n=1 Tax=Necator americanus TaxID=51031 RepID=A0ABR1E6W2_NECAM
MSLEQIFILLLVLTVTGSAWKNDPKKIVPCKKMKCPEGTKCELGKKICPYGQPCSINPTQCVPNEPEPGCGGEEGSGGLGEEVVNCPINMSSAKCGPACPQDCSKEPTCLAITCTDKPKCFCNPGYVLLNRNDPSLGCVLQEECPCAPPMM